MTVQPPLRVLVVGHSYVVGANQAKLCALAASQPTEVGLLVPRWWRDGSTGVHFDFRDNTEGQVRMFPSPTVLTGRVGGYLFLPTYVSRALRTFRPDVVHVEAEAFALVALQMVMASRAVRRPMTLFCWENVPRRLGVRLVGTRLVARSVAHLFAGSQEAAELVRGWGYRGPVTVTPQLGVTVREDVRPRPFPKGEFVVGFVGRLVPEKGVDLLLHAVARLVQEGVPLRAVVVGTGPEERRLRQLAAELGVAGRVSWHGWVAHEEVPGVLLGVDALVLPSRSVPRWREQFGRALIEAMSVGLPVVGSSCGAIPGVIGWGELVFPEGDWEALTRVLYSLAKDRGFYEAAARYCVERVRLFTHERIASQMVSVWKEFVGRGSRDGGGRRDMSLGVTAE